MQDRNNGSIIEGFVRGSYHRIFDNPIDVQHHPLTSWAQATVSGSSGNFTETKANLQTTIKGVLYVNYHASASEKILSGLSDLEDRMQASNSLDDLADAITEARTVLDQAFTRS